MRSEYYAIRRTHLSRSSTSPFGCHLIEILKANAISFAFLKVERTRKSRDGLLRYELSRDSSLVQPNASNIFFREQ